MKIAEEKRKKKSNSTNNVNIDKWKKNKGLYI
jgi:hypothetical protein